MSRKQRFRDKRTQRGPKYYILIFFRDPSTQQKSFYTMLIKMRLLSNNYNILTSKLI